MLPLISIIMPVYNVEKYLTQGISSILSQTYHNLEIILVDDGSTDQSGSICDDFAARDDRIAVIHTQNSGVSNARNEGLQFVHGEYVYFIDGDDWCDPDLLSVAYNHLLMTDADLLVFNYDDCYENERIQRFFFSEQTDCFGTDKMRFEYFFHTLLQYKQGFEVWNRLYKMEIIRQQKCLFPADINFAEDIYFNFLYVLGSRKIVCIPDVLYHRIQRCDSQMKLKKDPHIKQFIQLGDAMWRQCLTSSHCPYTAQTFYCLFIRLLNNQIAGIPLHKLAPILLEKSYYDFSKRMLQQALLHPYTLLKYFGIKSGLKQYLRSVILYYRLRCI